MQQNVSLVRSDDRPSKTCLNGSTGSWPGKSLNVIFNISDLQNVALSKKKHWPICWSFLAL
jgi:hypothetical protein